MAKRDLLPAVRAQSRAQRSLKQDQLIEEPAFLGDGAGNVQVFDGSNNPITPMCFARVGFDRTLIQVYNDKAPLVDGIQVIVGVDPNSEPGLYRVLRVRNPYKDGHNYYTGQAHGPSHQWMAPGGGHDPTFVDLRQFLPLRVVPTGSMSVTVFQVEAAWRAGFKTIDEQTLDLTASVPADGALYALITLDADGVLTSTLGVAVGDRYSLVPEDDIPGVPSGHLPLAAVVLYAGQTEIVERRDQKDVFDLRFPQYASAAPASMTGGIVWEHVVVVAASGGDYTDIQPASTAATTADMVFVAPGTYGGVTMKASVSIASMGTVVGDTIIAPVSGVPVTIPAVAGEYILKHFALTPPSGQVALSVASTSTATARVTGCSIGANGAASVDASAADATAYIELLECVLAGALNTKAVTYLRNTRGTTITQSSGAGNLTIDGGYFSGNLATVTGSTISLRNLPRIDGVVSGAGTIVGAYIDGSGNIISKGVVDAATGYRIGGAAASGRFLRGDGTNFISNTIQAGDTPGAALTKTDDTNVTLTLGGAPTTALLDVVSLTLGWTGALAVARGGIGVGTLAANGVLYGNGTSAVQALAVNATATNKFMTQVSSGAPTWNVIAASDLPATINAVTAFQVNSNEALAISGSALNVGAGFSTVQLASSVTLINFAAPPILQFAGTTVIDNTRAATFTAIGGTTITASGILKTTDTTDSTSSTASLIAAGGALITKQLYVGIGGTGTNSGVLTLDGGNGSGGRALIQMLRNTTFGGLFGLAGSSNDLTPGSVAGNFVLRNASTILFTADGGTTTHMTLAAGLQLGSPTGGDKGTGTLNVAGDVYKNNTAYTNPDFVLEQWATGRIDRYAHNYRAAGYTRLGIEDLERYVRSNFRLPRINDGAVGIFEMADIALEKIEELTTYIIELHKRLEVLEHGNA